MHHGHGGKLPCRQLPLDVVQIERRAPGNLEDVGLARASRGDLREAGGERAVYKREDGTRRRVPDRHSPTTCSRTPVAP